VLYAVAYSLYQSFIASFKENNKKIKATGSTSGCPEQLRRITSDLLAAMPPPQAKPS
jgi:hypothetical protein